MRVRHGEPLSNLFELFNQFFVCCKEFGSIEPDTKVEDRNKFVLTGWMDKTLRKKRGKINEKNRIDSIEFGSIRNSLKVFKFHLIIFM